MDIKTPFLKIIFFCTGYACGEQGHISRNCPTNQGGNNNGGGGGFNNNNNGGGGGGRTCCK